MKVLKMSVLGLLLSSVSISGNIAFHLTQGASPAVASTIAKECSDLMEKDQSLLGDMEQAINKINDAVRNNDTRAQKEALRDYREAKNIFFRCKSVLASSTISLR